MKKIIFAFLVLLGIDQLTKIVARFLFTPPKEVLPFLTLHMTENSGIAFSFPFPPLLLLILTAVLLGILGWVLVTKELVKIETVAFLFLFSGAAGNFIDRVLYGSVTDFLKFWDLPIFNFADIWITAGVVLFIWYELNKAKS
ncbi:signal peptidase II [Candidatus Gracilibacteria bacterium]|nr:signal peptidase II [Candidatus Gracilibacteria bacterium]